MIAPTDMSASGIVERHSMPAGPVVVVYHHLSECPDPLARHLGVTTDPDVFMQHMRYFARNFDLVSVAELVGDKPPPRALLVTFDDAYRSVLDVAAPILKTLNAPSVFFINPGTVQSESLPIDNLLSLAVEEYGLDGVLSRLGLQPVRVASTGDLIWRHVAKLDRLQTDTIKSRILQMLGRTLADIRRETRLFLGAADVRLLSDYRIDVGNHSMSHRFFRGLSQAELEQEIREARAELQRLSGQPVAWLSIPYGNQADATPKVMEVARSSGHRATFLVHGRSNRFRRTPDIFFRTSLRNTRPSLLPVTVKIAPLLRTVYHRLH